MRASIQLNTWDQVEFSNIQVSPPQDQYNQNFVDRWDSLINWEMRAKGEGGFFIEKLRSSGVKRVLDVAGGTGFHAIQLSKAGFDVTMADLSARMVEKAKENASDHAAEFDIHQCDWLDLDLEFSEPFDAIVCLGSSYPHLMVSSDRRAALGMFRKLLRKDGMLILDHRNFDAIRTGVYSNPNQLYYCGGGVNITPTIVDDVCTFSYRFPDNQTHKLQVAALRRDEVRAELKSAGFKNVSTFGDFYRNYNLHEVGFLIHIAQCISGGFER